MSERFDLVIVGAGISGVLTAARYALANPNAKVLLLEKDQNIGGRLRDTNIAQHRYSYGFNTISEAMYQYWDQTIKSHGEAEFDLPSFGGERQATVAALSGSKVSQVSIDDYFTKKGGRMIGGLASQRDWGRVDEIVQLVDQDPDKATAPFKSIWTGNRKSASAIALEHMAHSFGIPDVWSTTPACLIERATYHTSRLMGGDWETALEQTLKPYTEAGQVTVAKETMIVGATKLPDNGAWEIKTSLGMFTTPKLVIAQSPWEAIQWLPKTYWPTPLLNIVNKAKPVSVVVLSEKLLTDETLPNIVLITVEEVQAIVNNERKEVSFQATIDYEMTLQAPAVVKAVKRLKRARKKLNLSFQDAVSSNDHIALLPVGWGQSTAASERRLFEKLARVEYNLNDLYFVGDGYGASFDGDRNVIDSVNHACELLSEGSQTPA